MLVAKYTSNVSGYVPSFNEGYVYSVNEQFSNGVYAVEIESDTDFSSVMFGADGDNNVTSLLSVEYLKITNKVSSLLRSFRRCTAVTSINTVGFDTSNVTNMHAMFSGCNTLTSLDVSGFDTSNVIYMGYMFSGCNALTSLDVSGWDTSKVTEMTDIFTNCSVKSIGVLYCSDNTITELTNAITTQCDFYLDRMGISSPNPLVNFIEYKECKKEVVYYDTDDNIWKKPVLRQWDSIEKHSDGKYYYHKRSEEVVLNGSENWGMNNTYTITEITSIFRCNISEVLKGGNFICNMFIQDVELWDKDIEGIHAIENSIDIRINKTLIGSTVDTVVADEIALFKEWLSENNVTVVYQLAEEKVYECTNLDLITYADETNLLVKSGVFNPKVNLKVSKGVGNVVTMLQNKVTMLEQMVYNLMNMFNEQNNIDE